MLWFRNIQAYRLAENHGITPADIAEKLEKKPFVPCGNHDLFSQGWIAPATHAPDLFTAACQGAVLISLKTEEKLLPASVIRQQAEARILQIEAAENRKVGRREAREIRERIAEELTPRAFVRARHQRALLDLEQNWVWVESGSATKAENLLSLLRDTLGSLPTRLLDTQTSPQAAMTLWLQEGAPSPFSLDADCELRFPGEGGAVARLTRQPLEEEEIKQHLLAGKLATRLGLVWEDRIAFQLNENMALKRMSMLDVLEEQLEDASAEDQAALFDASLALMVGELRAFFPALVEALGGEPLQPA
ncbi:recombination associated protein RdgC [Formivibrio citricus]|uniref:Recombination-associated protein RdgC n=1 Tax=Formivibrio citricus TaxID=83765 RepID=A0A1I4WFI6_9NEIS|nr:recombination-associated protein RdgC [Formivibrio citricus]SFN12093.1 recombination associated protein RdgC [Formivibrio citricus]